MKSDALRWFRFCRCLMKMIPFIRYWLPALCWAVLIFCGSGNGLSASHTSRFLVPLLHALLPFLSAESLDWIHFAVRKCGHMAEYFVLTVLLWRGLTAFSPDARLHWRARPAFFAWALAVTYAASDEWHQGFTSSRQASVRDVLIDAVGASIGLLGALVLAWWRRRRAMRSEAPSPSRVLPLKVA